MFFLQNLVLFCFIEILDVGFTLYTYNSIFVFQLYYTYITNNKYDTFHFLIDSSFILLNLYSCSFLPLTGQVSQLVKAFDGTYSLFRYFPGFGSALCFCRVFVDFLGPESRNPFYLGSGQESKRKLEYCDYIILRRFIRFQTGNRVEEWVKRWKRGGRGGGADILVYHLCNYIMVQRITHHQKESIVVFLMITKQFKQILLKVGIHFFKMP